MDENYIFIDSSNSEEYKKKLLTWLHSDYQKKGSPEKHFWHNKSTIQTAFDACQALIVTNHKQEIIGYSIWSFPFGFCSRVEIDIIEVSESYRKQGICKTMLDKIIEHFPRACVLTCSPLPRAISVFQHLGWFERNNKYLKVIKESVSHSYDLKEGLVVAIFSQVDATSGGRVDYYTVKKHLEKYAIRYFKIEVNEQGDLTQPIIIPFHCDGYMAIYRDKELIVQGKPKHILSNMSCDSSCNYMILDRIIPSEGSGFSIQQLNLAEDKKIEEHIDKKIRFNNT